MQARVFSPQQIYCSAALLVVENTCDVQRHHGMNLPNRTLVQPRPTQRTARRPLPALPTRSLYRTCETICLRRLGMTGFLSSAEKPPERSEHTTWEIACF